MFSVNRKDVKVAQLQACNRLVWHTINTRLIKQHQQKSSPLDQVESFETKVTKRLSAADSRIAVQHAADSPANARANEKRWKPDEPELGFSLRTSKLHIKIYCLKEIYGQSKRKNYWEWAWFNRGYNLCFSVDSATICGSHGFAQKFNKKEFREMRNCDKTTRNFPRGKCIESKFKWILRAASARLRVRKAATNVDDLIESEFEWTNKERKENTRIGSRRLATIFISISASTLMFLEVNIKNAEEK